MNIGFNAHCTMLTNVHYLRIVSKLWAQAVASIHTHIYTLVLVDIDNKTRCQLMIGDRHCQVRDLLLSVIYSRRC